MSEVWLAVVGFEDYFEVSSRGRVRSLDRIVVAKDGRQWLHRGRILSTWDRDGYRGVHLKADGVDRNFSVHQLVCRAFNGKPAPHQVEVRHKDGTRDNNIPSNLEWGTVSENKDDMVRHGRHHNANKIKCIRGHEYTQSNTMIRPRKNGRTIRNCRICHNDRSNRQRKAKAAA